MKTTFVEFTTTAAGVEIYNPVWVRETFEKKVALYGGVEIGGTDKSVVYRFDDRANAVKFLRWADAERLEVEDITAEWEG